MLRESFHRDLQHLHDEIILLGSMVESMLTDAVDVLKRRDMDGSQRLVAYDQRVNTKRLEVEHEALTLIATQQPTAGDVRALAAILDIASELERIGDYAKGIAKINIMIGPGELIKPLIDIPRMADKARDMLHRALEAFINRDADLARSIPAEDDEVDALYNQVYHELITLIMKSPQDMDQATYLMWAAHNLERTADRVGNICERIIFTVTGEVIEFGMTLETT
ncbi:MAG: phosphate signaling complex protein PhoU [Anaerolineales bacterium]|nr:phosphate signaling complex protein PhoU [Anaerolineales bacterium]